MPGRMGEIPRQFPFAKRTPGRAIYLSGSYSRANGRDGSLLRFQNRFVQVSSFSRRPPDMHGSRAIRTITGEYNTKITHHEPAPWNARAGGTAMHNGRASSGSQYGREGHPFGPRTTSFVFHGAGDFDFAHTGPNFAACYVEETGAEFHRPADKQDLGSILHHASALDQRRRGTEASFHPPFQHRR